MAWLILSEDGPDGPRLRADAELMAAHWAYELSIQDRILAAGSLRSDDGETKTGSLLIVDASSRKEAMALISADPATKAGLRGRVTIRYWNPAILNRAEV
ncbi:YciI family protein [Tabrizicola sp. J26]|uniref:YciI family protein n=1 Tax=Alitabrizicola rongguiensis TaxID=2909234 RepID=UPI001F355ECD|nr:YciI family protein [Tabrizicola rongguiensis]MCF1707351.1 YciI family protein [Tabrizicola rongguiensis]